MTTTKTTTRHFEQRQRRGQEEEETAAVVASTMSTNNNNNIRREPPCVDHRPQPRLFRRAPSKTKTTTTRRRRSRHPPVFSLMLFPVVASLLLLAASAAAALCARAAFTATTTTTTTRATIIGGRTSGRRAAAVLSSSSYSYYGRQRRHRGLVLSASAGADRVVDAEFCYDDDDDDDNVRPTTASATRTRRLLQNVGRRARQCISSGRRWFQRHCRKRRTILAVAAALVFSFVLALRGGVASAASSSAASAATDVGVVSTATRSTGRTLRQAAADLSAYMAGPKSDTLLLLLATALIPAVAKKLGASPILGFLASGMLLGPNGCGLISGIHTTETLAELGIVFFLFEMGIELSLERLKQMKKDVFGLGLLQFSVTAVAVAALGRLVGGLPANALVVLGGGLALSSSAFVLQLLKDKNQLATRYGKAAFGVLLFQDLAVVPLLVVTPILAGRAGMSLTSAVSSAVVKAGMALTAIAFTGHFLLNPLFKIVAQAQSQTAFLGVVLLTVLSMSFMTEGLGLSNTLGAFLAGVLLSETKYRYQIEADIAPFRGVLLGLFFVTVGFEIDCHLIARNLPTVGSLVLGIMALKTIITTALSLAFGLSLATSQNTGLVLSQSGEFAFVAFGLARSLGILDKYTTKLMLTSVSLTMALTPFVSDLGGRIAKRLEEGSDFTHYLGQDRDANEIKESEDFTVVVGYGVVGKVVCDLLDRKFIKYVGLEIDPNKAIQARNAGLPVFYGDIGRQEVAEAFNVGNAAAVIVCIADRAQCNRAVIALRRWYPDLKIFSRAADADHANRLQNTLNVVAMVPILPEDNLLLTLPFGGAVMKALGVPTEEANAILEAKRKEVLTGKGLFENEEESALMQMGISVPEDSSSSSTSTSSSSPGGGGAVAKVKVEGDGSSGDDAGAASQEEDAGEEATSTSPLARIEEAAAERVEETREKSPFVAQVIEDVCGTNIGAVEDDDDGGVDDNANDEGPQQGEVMLDAVVEAELVLPTPEGEEPPVIIAPPLGTTGGSSSNTTSSTAIQDVRLSDETTTSSTTTTDDVFQ